MQTPLTCNVTSSGVHDGRRPRTCESSSILTYARHRSAAVRPMQRPRTRRTSTSGVKRAERSDESEITTPDGYGASRPTSRDSLPGHSPSSGLAPDIADSSPSAGYVEWEGLRLPLCNTEIHERASGAKFMVVASTKRGAQWTAIPRVCASIQNEKPKMQPSSPRSGRQPGAQRARSAVEGNGGAARSKRVYPTGK